MIRVALVITELDIGGAERQLVNLATGLDRRWYKPRVYAVGVPPPSGRDELVERLKQAAVPVEFLHARRWWQAGPTAQRLADLLAEFRPHVMQSFLFHANVVGTMAARKAGVPRVCLGIRVADPRRWRHWIERRIARQADRVICVSDAVARFAQQRLKLASGKRIVIPNGIDLDRYPATPLDLQPLGVPPGRKVMTFVGRLDMQKGLDWLLPQLKTLDSAHLVIVGDGPLRERLERQAMQQEITERVTFTGWRGDVPEILAASDLFVLPSRYEGMPNALLEAMASGLAVMSTRVEGVAEVLGDDQQQTAGFGGPEFGHRLLALLHMEDAQRSELGAANRRILAQKYALSTMIAGYERLFAELTAGMPGTGHAHRDLL